MHLRVNPMKKIFVSALGASLLLLALSATCYAQSNNDNYYIVELIIFSNELRMYKEEESWPTPTTLTVADDLLFLKPLPIDAVYPELFIQKSAKKSANASPYLPLLANDDKAFNFAAERIRLAGRHRLLSHQTWLQKMDDESNAKEIAILAGKERNGYYEVSGSVRLHLGRYLHINTNLWRVIFADENTAAFAEDNQQSVDIELPFIAEKPTANGIQDVSWHSEKPQQPAIDIIAPMQQKRRMRSREVHYIDHPLFGLIIELRPYQQPTNN